MKVLIDTLSRPFEISILQLHVEVQGSQLVNVALRLTLKTRVHHGKSAATDVVLHLLSYQNDSILS